MKSDKESKELALGSKEVSTEELGSVERSVVDKTAAQDNLELGTSAGSVVDGEEKEILSTALENSLVENSVADNTAALQDAAGEDPEEQEAEPKEKPEGKSSRFSRFKLGRGRAPAVRREKTVEPELPKEDIEDDDEEDETEEPAEPTDLSAEEFEFLHDDPLAPAYDLERGNLLDSRSTADLPWQSDIKTAKGFFNAELLYRFDILEPDDQKKLAGTYRIELKGYQGGVWTILVGEDLQVLNRREEADLVITMQQRDFLELVNGRINPQLALLGQKMKVQGDVKRALDFQALLTPSFD